MKELSMEEKAKAYDEAISRAESYKENTDGVGFKDVSDLIEGIFPELKESKESEDVDFKKVISDILLVDNDEIREILDSNGILIQDVYAWLEKQGEQKSVDKAEPKFKDGDWVVDDCGNVWKIEGILNQFYILEDVEGGESRPTIEWVDKTYHFWTIQDAKPGDMLAMIIDDYLSPFIAIYKNGGIDFFNSYCLIGLDGRFYKGAKGHPTDNIHPATKEQRDLLFQKMKEAWYEWDGDKKELRKIEDEHLVIDEGKAEMDYCFTKMMNGEQVSSAWTEEDERLCSCLIKQQEESLDDVRNDKYGHSEIISDLKDMYHERIDWLKSLKDRVQPKWKPSDTQMKWFRDILDYHQFSTEGYKIMQSLYDDLKKLKE